MPNHCSSRLLITGPSDQRKAFKEFARGSGPNWDLKSKKDHECVYSSTGVCMVCTIRPPDLDDLDLNQFVPVPETLLVGTEGRDAFNSGGYDWVNQNWGTKWGCYDTGVEDTSKRLTYYFKSAWAPFKDSVHEAMSRKFPLLKLELKYAERGSAYYGTRITIGGKIVHDDQRSGRPTSALMCKLWSRSG